ncbi:aminotransferase class IV [Microbulbifer sp. ARAS458-1]|uniref:aminotransferase class IV n=1 Tax=Microbulbifer sp. ARAS458-1 TaxID=3140242 RepID=UPI00387801FF
MTDTLSLYYSASGEQQAVVPDSAFEYGLLETMRADRGSIPLLQLHIERLTRSANLARNTQCRIAESLGAVAARTQHWAHGARLRLRYGSVSTDTVLSPHWDISAFPLEVPSPWDNGVLLGPCDTRLSEADTRSPFSDSDANSCIGSVQSDHLGCKLLDRKTYDLAANEWRFPAFCSAGGPLLEPLLCDPDGFAIEASRSNLLILRDGCWRTPNLGRFGVRGVMLRWLAGQVEIGDDDISLSELQVADELAVCNSVRGVVPARLLSVHRSPSGMSVTPNESIPVMPGPAVSALQQRISEKLW